MSIEDAVDASLDEMPDDFLIKPYLLQNREEVETMCITEYNEEETFNIIRDECESKGRTEGKIETLWNLVKKGLLTEKAAADSSNMSLEEFRKGEELYCTKD